MAFSTDMFTGCDGLFICMAQWANTVTSGYFWLLMNVGLVVVLFMATFRFGTSRAAGFSAFLGGSIAIMLAIMGLMSYAVLAWFIGALVLGIVIARMME